ncbi:MAG TPA: N-acetylmuramoyl-L-alanine amidase [Candidatus Limnocylindrales bacterium]
MTAGLLLAALAVGGLPILQSAVHRGVDIVRRDVEVAVDRQQLVHLPIAASHVVLHWTGAPEAVLSIAVGRTPDQLSEEIPLGADEDADPAAVDSWSEVVWAGGARYARVTSDRPIAHLTVSAIDADASRGIDQSGVVLAAVNQPAVITRAGWGANEDYSHNAGGYVRFAPNYTPLQKIIVHHTAGRNNDPNPAATIRAIFYNHAVQRGYGDIDYNYLIDAQGRVYEGRLGGAIGTGGPTAEDLAGNALRAAHALNFNDATMGVVLLGNFTSVMPTSSARTALVNLLAWKAERHGMDPKGSSTYVNPVLGTTKFLKNISGHRDVNATACPGQLFYNTFPQLRQDVADRIAATTGASHDHTPPGVIGQKTLGTNPSGAHTQRFGLIFTEPVTGLAPADFEVTGTSDGWTVDSVTGTASTYIVTVKADEGGGGPDDGTVILTLHAGGVTDKAAHTGPPDDVSTTVAFAAETEPPTAILYAVAHGDEPSGTSYGISVLFDEPVTDFGPEDVQIGGTSNAATPWVLDRILGQDTMFNFTIHRDNPATGTLTVQVADGGVLDLAGNEGDGSNVISKYVDHSAPTNTSPRTNLRADTTLNGGAMRVNLTWAGTDVGPAGIASYEVGRSYDGKAFETIGTGVTSASFNWSTTPGHTYQFRVRAKDKAGNVGAWVTAPTVKPALTEQTSPWVHWTGSTTTTSYSKYSGGSQRYLGAAGASATYTTTASSLSFVTTKGPNRGSAQVWIDDVLAATVDLTTASTTYQVVAFARTWSTVASHKIKVVAVGGPIPRVDVDAFGVIR